MYEIFRCTVKGKHIEFTLRTTFHLQCTQSFALKIFLKNLFCGFW